MRDMDLGKSLRVECLCGVVGAVERISRSEADGVLDFCSASTSTASTAKHVGDTVERSGEARCNGRDNGVQDASNG